MTQRTAKLVSALFASLLAGAPFVTASHGAPAEADKCLSGPKGAPPAGGHWYYRIDRATKRSCWYIGDAREKLSRAAPATSPPPASSAPSPNSASTPLSVANARAELPLPQTRVGPEIAATGRSAAEAANPASSRGANAEDGNAQRSVVASRWFEPTSMASSAPSQPRAGNSADQPSAVSEAAPPTPAATFRLAAADASVARSPGSVVQLLIAIVAALALAGLLARVIFRLSGARGSGRRNIQVDRRVNWDLAGISGPPLSADAGGGASRRDFVPLPEGSLPRDPGPASDPNERIAQMLTRLARSAAT